MVRYYNENVDFVLKHKLLNNRWLKTVAGSEMKKLGNINIIFCSDAEICLSALIPCGRMPCITGRSLRMS